MISRNLCVRVLSLLVLFATFVSIVVSQTGAYDFGLGGSSVMWFPRPSAVFLNPAELGRIREGVFSLNTHRISSLNSFGGAYFVPFVGTFAAGIARFGPAQQYSVGYGGTWGPFGGGIGFSGFRNTDESFGISFGGSWQAFGSKPASGLHAGFSVSNLSDQAKSPLFSINAGVAYWILPELLRAQSAYRHTAASNDGLVGVSLQALPVFGLGLGTRSFKEVMAGVSLQLPFVSIDLSAGKAGAFLSINAAVSEPASMARDRNYELGLLALDGNRYYDAEWNFRLAHAYDPSFMTARAAADSAASILGREREDLTNKAEALFVARRFVESSRAFSHVLTMDPENEHARARMRAIQSLLKNYFIELIITGDSLRARREIEPARRNYQLALDLDPGNDSLLARITGLREVAKENVRTMLNRARLALDRNQLDEAEREFEQVLALEPDNSRARQGLTTVRGKRIEELFERGKRQFAASNYFEALKTFLQVLEHNPRHREGGEYLDRARQMLKVDLETYFRSGLQYYTKDNYQAAMEEWDKVLLIDPNHQGTLEYRKRAEEKLKALQRLK
ncbi:MAG: hypothetical protein HY563_10065 [Ignavibacteriales bacterium]|nr:hypothetical protein [Ignavibacteriales bacterium]